MSKLTVIMPAAGKGTRLNLPYPKEILRLDKEQALIDHSFDFFRDYGRKDVEFVIVVNEQKTEIIEYLARYKDRYNISFTYQNPNEFEYTGAIKSARHLFGEHNVILLPDTIMKLPPNVDLVEALEGSLTETGFTFFYKEEKNSDILLTPVVLNKNYNANSMKIDNACQIVDYMFQGNEQVSQKVLSKYLSCTVSVFVGLMSAPQNAIMISP